METNSISGFFREYGQALTELVLIWIFATVIWKALKKSENMTAKRVVREFQDFSPLFIVISIVLTWIFISSYFAIALAWLLAGIRFNKWWYERQEEKRLKARNGR